MELMGEGLGFHIRKTLSLKRLSKFQDLFSNSDITGLSGDIVRHKREVQEIEKE